ncbi:MAG: hypothetical protein JJU03_00340 [Idiomarina sp.]|nr:hypothetical protein [Idiomarina sp.]
MKQSRDNKGFQEHGVDDFIAPACDGFVDTLFQDDAILLINKPAGLLSVSGNAFNIR